MISHSSLLHVVVVVVVVLFVLCTCVLVGSNSFTYVNNGESISWSDAESYCSRIYGTHLASIHSEEEQLIAYTGLMDSNNNTNNLSIVWIGLNDKLIESNFLWSDGTSCNYSNWSPITMTNKSKNEFFDIDDTFLNCVGMNISDNGYWINIECSNNNINPSVNSFICNTRMRYLFFVSVVCSFSFYVCFFCC